MIYFIQSQEYMKVGYTSNLRSRYKKYVTENPHPIKLKGKCNGGFDIEKKIHRQLKEWHFRGEWFKLDEEGRLMIKIYEIIKEHKDTEEPTKTKVKRQKETYLTTFEAIREYGTASGMLVILPHIKDTVCKQLEISQSTFTRHITKLIKVRRLSRIEDILYIL